MTNRRARHQIERALESTSAEYLRVALERFLPRAAFQPSAWPEPQVTIGMLGISCELMLKAFIASRALPKLYRGANGAAIEAALADSGPSEASKLLHERDIKTIEFAEAVSAARALLPDARWFADPLRAHLHLMPLVRNRAVHGALPEVDYRHTEWVAFAVLEVHRLLSDAGFRLTRLPAGADEFARRFQASAHRRVEEAVEAARKRIKHGRAFRGRRADEDEDDYFDDPDREPDFHDEFGGTADAIRTVKCPVCLADAEAFAERSTTTDGNDYLFVYAFGCLTCGLRLVSEEEVRLAGIELLWSVPPPPPSSR